MPLQEIRNYLEKFATISDEDWDFFSTKLVRKEFDKKQLLLKSGKIENFLSFVEKGVVRFYIPKNDNEITFAFCFHNEFVSAYDSFLNQTASRYHIETLSDTALWRISYTDLQSVYMETKIGEHMGRMIAESLFQKKSAREMAFLNQSAEERYLRLFNEHPEIIRQIPLKYVASYIGITPQALSRIRKRIS